MILNPPVDSPDNFHLTSSDLHPAFSAFSGQLFALLGVPPLPTGLQKTDPSSVITGWQFDALARRRTLENAHHGQETLQSIVRLVHKIKNMPIGEGVKTDVLDALSALEMVCALIDMSAHFILTRK